MASNIESTITGSVDRYFSRIDEALSTMNAPAAAVFLSAQIDRWTADLQRFIAIVDADKPIPARFAGAHVTDFHCTIARLEGLRSSIQSGASSREIVSA